MTISVSSDFAKGAFSVAVRRLSQATTERTPAEDIVSEFIESQGFRYFSYVVAQRRVPGRSSGIVLSNYPAPWLNRYRIKSYDQIDEIVCNSRRERLPFHWGSGQFLSRINRLARKVCIEAKDFGIVEGFTVPVHGPEGECGVFSAAITGQTDTIFEPWSEPYQRIVAIAPFVHAFGIESSKSDETEVLTAPIILTSQEKHCLRWTLEGKTAWEVSQIMSLSKPTIEYHIQKSMRKLNASNKIHAAALARRLGLI